MKVLLLDVWQDLRRKRLWPVAAALVVAMVAAPLLLLGGGRPEASSTEGAVTPRTPEGRSVGLSDVPLGGSSTLDRFDSHNPFKPGRRGMPEGSGLGAAADGSGGLPSLGAPAADGAGSSSTGSSPADAAPSSGSGQASGGEAAADKSTKPDLGEGGATEGDPGLKTPSPSDKPGRTTSPERSRLQVASYEIDAVYGRTGAARHHNGVEPLSVIPGRRRFLLFSGVTSDGREAVFTVLDPALTAERGEGHCVQVVGRCAVLHLREGQERRFEDAHGEGFRLRLVEIRPVEVRVRHLSREVRDALDELGLNL